MLTNKDIGLFFSFHSECSKYYLPWVSNHVKNYLRFGFKALAIKEGVTKTMNHLSLVHYKNLNEGIVQDPYEDNLYIDTLFKYGKEVLDAAVKVNNSYYARVQRLRSRISRYLVKSNCIFATFTFTDEVLNSTSVNTRRRYVSRFLRSISNDYVANIDYGSKNEREHYHALVCTNWISDKWPYGFCKYEKVRLEVKSSELLAKYISKLTNHAIKETVKRNYYIYSRDKNRLLTNKYYLFYIFNIKEVEFIN